MGKKKTQLKYLCAKIVNLKEDDILLKVLYSNSYNFEMIVILLFLYQYNHQYGIQLKND